VEADVYAAEFEGEDGGGGEEGREIFFGLRLAEEFADVGTVCVLGRCEERGGESFTRLRSLCRIGLIRDR
jgi:hypothetical protein